MVRLVEAQNVFSKIDFQDDVDYDIYPKSIYRCPICDYELSFSMRNFKKYSFNQNSPFSIVEQEKIKSILRLSKRKESNSFIDFYCPQCNTPTRIYFTVWAGGRYTGGYHLEFVVVDDDV